MMSLDSSVGIRPTAETVCILNDQSRSLPSNRTEDLVQKAQAVKLRPVSASFRDSNAFFREVVSTGDYP